MLKTPQNGTKIKPTTRKFLYEFAAFPLKTREEFMQKLLKRKNAELQKNVHLLKIIYQHLAEDKMLEWNDERVCNLLNVSIGMLYCHKSRLLKCLRFHYFNWKIIEKNEFTNISKYKNEVSLQYARAEKMFEIGMNKEGKNVFTKLEAYLKNKRKRSINNEIILFEVYSRLCWHYSNIKSRVLFNIYFKNLKRIQKSLLTNPSVKADAKLQSKILIEIYIANTNNILFNVKNKNCASKAIEFLKLAYNEALKLKKIERQIEILLLIGRLYRGIYNNKKAIEFLEKGCLITKRNKLKAEYITFKTSILIIDFRSNDISTENSTKKLKIYYNNFSSLKTNLYWKEKFLFDCVTLLSESNDRNFYYSIIHRYNSHLIITRGFESSIKTLYEMKFNYYTDKIKILSFEYDTELKIPYLFIKDLNKTYQRKIENTICELSVNSLKIYSVYFAKSIYIFMLYYEFWKGRELDLSNSNLILKKIDWLNKHRGEFLKINDEIYNVLKLGIEMFQELKYLEKERFLDKFGRRFEELIQSLLYEKDSNILDYYFLFTFITHETKYKELSGIVKKVYLHLNEKYPDLFKSIIKEIEESKSKNSDVIQAELPAFQAA